MKSTTIRATTAANELRRIADVIERQAETTKCTRGTDKKAGEQLITCYDYHTDRCHTLYIARDFAKRNVTEGGIK